MLCSTGLFKQSPALKFDLFTEYKRGCPRLQPTGWTSSPCAVVILPDTLFGLQPLEETVVKGEERSPFLAYSKQIVDVIPTLDLAIIPTPRLAPLFIGLCRRYLDQADDSARIAIEKLVDGMILDQEWHSRNISAAGADVSKLSQQLISSKLSRMDEYSGNKVTCFVTDEAEAKRLRDIPGSGWACSRRRSGSQ